MPVGTNGAVKGVYMNQLEEEIQPRSFWAIPITCISVGIRCDCKCGWIAQFQFMEKAHSHDSGVFRYILCPLREK